VFFSFPVDIIDMRKGLIKRREGCSDDATGQLIKAYYEGRSSYELVEHAEGFICISGGAKVYFSEYEDWPCHLKKGIELAQGRVLDVGCGAGRVALYLQDRNIDVVGVDVSQLAVQVAKKRGLRKARVLDIEEIGSLRSNFYDTILLFGNGFGLLGTPRRAVKLLKGMYRITTDDARILAESRASMVLASSSDRVKQFSVEQSRIRIRYKDFIGSWFDYMSASPSQMQEIAYKSGWKLATTFESAEPPYYLGVLQKQ
jgi:SAM-dependent methyltransferase